MRALVPHDPGLDRFFYDAVGAPEHLRREVFFLGYHLHWPYGEIMRMETAERREFVRLLADAIERQNEAAERAAAGRGVT